MAQPTISKTGAIKKYLTKHPDATASEIIPALKKDGINVSQGLVNNTRSRLKQQGDIRVAASRPPGSRSRSPAKRNGEITETDLKQFANLERQLGGRARTKRVVDALDAIAPTRV